jgi:hypothetical protein
MRAVWSALIAIATILGVPGAGDAAGARSSSTTAGGRRAPATNGGLPLVFEENVGQHHADARYLARSRGFHAWFADGETVLSLDAGEHRDVLRMRFGAAGVRVAPVGGEVLPGRSHYFLGNDRSTWVTDAPHRAGVVYPDVVPGVDVAWRSGPRSALEYVVTAAAGADAERFEITFDGALGLDVSATGDLVVTTPRGEVRHGRPSAFQETETGIRRVTCTFDVRGEDRVGFRVGSHDPARALVIDPTVGWSTYYGGSGGEWWVEVASDSAGAAYVTGRTTSTNFPCVGAAQATLAGSGDAFVVKIPAAGTSVTYATYVGGSGQEDSRGVAVDSSGAVYVSGYTTSTDFPTVSAYQSSNGGGLCDAYVFKLNASGSALTYATYLGGNSGDRALRVAVDSNGEAHIAGDTGSTGFTSALPYGGSGDAFVAKLGASGSTLSWFLYLGGSWGDTGHGIAIDSDGSVVVAGETASGNFPVTTGSMQTTFGGGGDGFVARIAASGGAVTWASFLGGSDYDIARQVALGPQGAVHVVGETVSTNFPTTSGAFQSSHASDGGVWDGFAAKVSSDGGTLSWSTCYGGDGTDKAQALVVLSDGSVWIGGVTGSTDLPVQSPFQSTRNDGNDGFVAKLSSTGASLTFGTYINSVAVGSPTEWVKGLAAGPGGLLYVAGYTSAASFPVQGAVQGSLAGGDDAFVVRFDPPAPTAPLSLATAIVTDRLVALQWVDTSAEEANFQVERALAGGPFLQIAAPPANATAHPDPTVSGETAYDYRVRAANISGTSPWSNVLRVTSGPNAPHSVSVTPVSNSRVSVAWTDRSSVETSFRIERRVGAAPTWVHAGMAGPNASTFTDLNAPAESAIHYRVRAESGTLLSEWATADDVTTAPANPGPRTPVNLSDGAASVTWNDVSATESGYELQRAPGWPGLTWTTVRVLPPGSTAFIDTDVEPESVYSYRVRAFNDLGTSDWVDLGRLTTGPYSPTDLVAEALSPTRTAVSWTDRSKMEAGYEVLRSEDGTFVPVADLPANAEGLTEGSLSQETGYTYRVRTFNQYGKSAWSEVTVKTPSALVVRSAKIVRGKGKKPKPSVLTATGEFDVGGTGIDLAGDATLVVGGATFDLSGLTLEKGVYRFTSDAITLDLTPSKTGQSRVTFKLTLRGAPVDALDPDGETVFAYRNGPFDASGLVQLTGGRFAIGTSRLVDPALVVSSFTATLRGKGRDSLKLTGYFDASAGVPPVAPDVLLHLDRFEFRAKGTEFRTAGNRQTFSIRASVGALTIARKVVLDWAKGTVQVSLVGADLGEFEVGAVPVSVSLEIGAVKCGDTYVAACNGKSLKY